MSDEIYRRLERLEATDEQMRDALNQLVINTSIMNENLKKLSSLEPRLRDIESQMTTNKVVMSSIRWVSTIIAGTAFTIITAAILQNVMMGS